MLKKISLVLALSLSIIGGCGFHTPLKSETINVIINSNSHSRFAGQLSPRLNKLAKPSLQIDIIKETTRKDITSFDTSGSDSGYNLTYTLEIQFKDMDGNDISKKIYSANRSHTQLISAQADNLQIEESYSKLSASVARKVLRELNYINEN